MARLHVAAGVVAHTLAVVCAVVGLADDDWVVVERSEERVAGKDALHWALVSLSLALCVASFAVVASLSWGGDGLGASPAYAPAVAAAAGLAYAAAIDFSVEHELGANEVRGSGYDYTLAAAALLTVAFAASLYHYALERAKGPHTRVLGRSQRVFALVLGMVVAYLCLGGLMYSFIEDWSFRRALVFSTVTISTIGWGDDAPETNVGKVLLFPYAMVGFAYLTYSITVLWDQVLDSVRRRARRVYLSRRDRVHALHTKELLLRARMLALVAVFALLIVGGGAVFAHWEGWSLGIGVWSMFQVATTIGYGDFPITDRSSSAFFVAYVLVTLGAISYLLGLAGQTVASAIDRKRAEGRKAETSSASAVSATTATASGDDTDADGKGDTMKRCDREVRRLQAAADMLTPVTSGVALLNYRHRFKAFRKALIDAGYDLSAHRAVPEAGAAAADESVVEAGGDAGDDADSDERPSVEVSWSHMPAKRGGRGGSAKSGAGGVEMGVMGKG